MTDVNIILILPAAIYYGSLLRRMLLALSLQNVPIQVLSIFVLIKMIMFMRTLTDLLQPKMEAAAIMVKLLLLIKMVISFGNFLKMKILTAGLTGAM